MHPNEIDAHEVEQTSKTKAKRHMDDLQDLGTELIELNRTQLAKFDLPEDLLAAILEAQKITANGAIRRQRQYIGKLMRKANEENIRLKLDEIKGTHLNSVRKLHECEKWRDRLLANDNELNLFLESYSVDDIGQLRNLIRQVRKEIIQNKPHNYRKLFQFIREIVEAV